MEKRHNLIIQEKLKKLRTAIKRVGYKKGDKSKLRKYCINFFKIKYENTKLDRKMKKQEAYHFGKYI